MAAKRAPNLNTGGQAKARRAVSPPAPAAEAAAGVACSAAEVAALPMHARENPRYLGGDALRQLAHLRGISRSEAAQMTDERLRTQLNMRSYHARDAEEASA